MADDRVGVALLGATGSIGRSTLAVLARHADRFRVVAITANRRAAELISLARELRPELAVLVDSDPQTPDVPGVAWRHGRDGLVAAATHPRADIVLNAVVGAAGLEASLAALRAGKRLALANKESLVVGGPLVLEAMEAGGGELIPVDSEHSAVLQCLQGPGVERARRIILTASGGPFREKERGELVAVTPAEALNHPTWSMGAKITVDSATLVNKALEVIEAHFLFGFDYDHIDVVIHPQSIVHSMVELSDGSVLAQLGQPNMELPILYALSHPDRLADEAATFDPVGASPITFEPVDPERFPAFALGLAAGRRGGTAPAAYNAANEEAVAAFLSGRLDFPGIADVIGRVLEEYDAEPVSDLETVLAADRSARAAARILIESRC